MTDENYDLSAGPDENDLEDDGTLDASDTLEGDPGDDPLDTGIAPPDRWSAGEGVGTTPGRGTAGRVADQLLAEEELDVNLRPGTTSLTRQCPAMCRCPVRHWSPRTRERIQTPNPTLSRETSASTVALPVRRKQPCISRMNPAALAGSHPAPAAPRRQATAGRGGRSGRRFYAVNWASTT
jgi:hypothetical protein